MAESSGTVVTNGTTSKIPPDAANGGRCPERLFAHVIIQAAGDGVIGDSRE